MIIGWCVAWQERGCGLARCLFLEEASLLHKFRLDKRCAQQAGALSDRQSHHLGAGDGGLWGTLGTVETHSCPAMVRKDKDAAERLFIFLQQQERGLKHQSAELRTNFLTEAEKVGYGWVRTWFCGPPAPPLLRRAGVRVPYKILGVQQCNSIQVDSFHGKSWYPTLGSAVSSAS